MASVSGTVLRYGSAERITGATVKATASGQKVVQVVTDDDGDFSFPDLAPAKWSFVALHEDCFPNSPITLDVMADVSKLEIKLQRLAGEEDKAAGQKFFTGLLIALGALIVLYVVLHLFLPPAAGGGLAAFAIWSSDPLRFLEIIMWGLAGVLVNKIINCGWFLRSQKFYREGMVMHLAHLVATPLLVLVAVILLSLATFRITLTGGSEVTLDLSQPAIMIAVAFLLGSSPWPLWNMIERTAQKVAGQ